MAPSAKGKLVVCACGTPYLRRSYDRMCVSMGAFACAACGRTLGVWRGLRVLCYERVDNAESVAPEQSPLASKIKTRLA